jgi:hypothetical protein
MTPNPDHPHLNASAFSSLKAALFTDDESRFQRTNFRANETGK